MNPIYTAIFGYYTHLYVDHLSKSYHTPTKHDSTKTPPGTNADSYPGSTFLPLIPFTRMSPYYGEKHRFLFTIVGISDYCRHLPVNMEFTWLIQAVKLK